MVGVGGSESNGNERGKGRAQGAKLGDSDTSLWTFLSEDIVTIYEEKPNVAAEVKTLDYSELGE